ncbi:MAG: NAD-dependent epimerase/dehydratase family protein [Paludibacteraceae bacterium]|nr:NAD-dependent epimerase/dehydratase family protein [Paludibacteraceae bacterium]
MTANLIDFLPLYKLTHKHVLITGASGLIGSAIVDMLIKHTSAEVYAMFRDKSQGEQRFKQYKENERLHFVIGDINEPLKVNIHFQYIIHAASNANPTAYSIDPVGTIWTNINGTRNLLEYGRTHNIERFLYVSSGEVYGNGENTVWSETDCGFIDNLDPRSCYPLSKRTAESLCISYADQYNLDIVIARPCHTYGPFFTEKDNRAFAQFTRKARNKENIILKSAGEQYRSWIYIDDCVSGILTILLKGVTCNAYNIANENSNITIKELAERIAEVAGTKVTLQIPENIESKGYSRIKRAIFSVNKLKALGWDTKVSIDEGIYKTINNL